LKAKTSYRRCCIKLIVERLEAERKELDIRIEAELETEQREIKSSIEVVAKVGRMRLYSKVEAMAEHIEVARKLDIEGKLKVKDSL
jgi:hypothetical protein